MCMAWLFYFAEKNSESIDRINESMDPLIVNQIEKKWPTVPLDRPVDRKNDGSGLELTLTDDNVNYSDLVVSQSPPKEKDVPSGDKRTKLFRTASGPISNKKKQTLSFSIPTDQPPCTQLRSVLEASLSPTNVEPRKVLLDQLAKVFTPELNFLPEVIVLVGPQEQYGGAPLASKLSSILSSAFKSTFAPQNTAEVKVILAALMNKIHKYFNSNAKAPNTIKVVLVGGDWLQGSVLRHYVDLLGVRNPEWIQHFRYYIVPMGSSAIARYLSSIDTTFGSLFGTDSWTQISERLVNLDVYDTKNDVAEFISRFKKYIYANGPCTQIPIAEAMVNYKEEESCQIFIPFISDVRLFCNDNSTLSIEGEELPQTSLGLQGAESAGLASGSPPQSGRSSPPLPNTPSIVQGLDAVELQLDYWPSLKPTQIDGKDTKSQTKDKDKEGKCSIKSQFRSLQVWRLPPYPVTGEMSNGLTLSYSTKEKRQKIMRLGKKKERDRENDREQIVDGIARIICSPKSHHVPLRVYIDGTEWSGVKFFQLAAQWPTHVRNFPLSLIGTTNVND